MASWSARALRQLSYVLFLISGLSAIAFLLLITGTIWSDFAQRVYISFLGTSASAGLAVGLYYLKREHDRQDAVTKADADAQVRYRDEWLSYLRGARQGLLDNAGTKVIKEFQIMATALMYTATDYRYIFKDSALVAFCIDISEVARDIAAIPHKDATALMHGVHAYTQVVSLAPVVLSRYAATRDASDLANFKAEINTSYRDTNADSESPPLPDGKSA